MLRRLALALFVVFYTVSGVGLAIGRTQTWAAEHSRETKHSRTEGAKIGDWHKRSVHHRQTRLVEDTPGLVSPFVRTSTPPRTETTLHHLLSAFSAAQIGEVISLRAPPVTAL
jgi:hypothetical protein